MSDFQRKHYEVIARVIRETHEEGLGVSFIAFRLGALFEADNPAFRRQEFLKRCGLTDEAPY